MLGQWRPLLFYQMWTARARCLVRAGLRLSMNWRAMSITSSGRERAHAPSPRNAFKLMEHHERLAGKQYRSPTLVAQGSPSPYSIPLHRFHQQEARWKPSDSSTQEGHNRDSLITAISWNIYFGDYAVLRTNAILQYLEESVVTEPEQTIIMFQEVLQESLDQILKSEWVQQHFDLTNVTAPEDFCTSIAGDSFIMITTDWRAHHYFTIMLVSKDLPVVSAFRVPFVTEMGRDVLGIDVLLASTETSEERSVLRLCTTHLESLFGGSRYRPTQLSLISQVLKGDTPGDEMTVAGVVGGDMNSIDKSDHELPKLPDIQLQDAWEAGPEMVIPKRKGGQKDLTNGLAKGYTWGYQSESGRRTGKRLDKFLFTGSLRYVPLDEGEQVTRGMQRLGVGLMVTVKAVQLGVDWVVSPEMWERFQNKGIASGREAVDTMIEVPASDHYGILAKFELN